MDSTIQETNSQAAHAVDCHYSSCWQAIYTKVIQHRQKVHTKTNTQTNRQQSIVHMVVCCKRLLMNLNRTLEESAELLLL